MKETPIITQEQVYNLVRTGLEKAVGQALDKTYNNPVEGIVTDAVKLHSDEIRSLIYQMIGSTIKDKDFQEILRQELKHKVAKNLVAKLEGAIEKSVNEYRQDPVMRSRMTLALEEIINQQSSKEGQEG